MPVAFQLTGGHRGDVPQAARLIDGHQAEVSWPMPLTTPTISVLSSPSWTPRR
jgi:hypothetical protein